MNNEKCWQGTTYVSFRFLRPAAYYGILRYAQIDSEKMRDCITLDIFAVGQIDMPKARYVALQRVKNTMPLDFIVKNWTNLIKSTQS